MPLYRVPILDKWEWQKIVLDKDLTSPPLTPNKGDRYLIYGIGSGDWVGEGKNIAEYDGVSWIFITKSEGMILYVKDENRWYSYIASWEIFPPQSGAVVKQTEIDFGATPISEKEFTIVDSDVLITSKLIGNIAYEAPTGKDLDELEMDAIDLKFQAGVSLFKIYAKGLEGYLHDKFKINYIVR